VMLAAFALGKTYKFHRNTSQMIFTQARHPANQSNSQS
jgi:hypothetical protein